MLKIFKGMNVLNHLTEGVMQKLVTVLLVVMMMLVGATAAVAADSATKAECIKKCKDAASMVRNMGLDKTIAEVNKKDGAFVWKNTYVFMMDLEGKMIAHPMKASLIGRNLLDLKDSNGKEFFKDFMKVAKGKGEGWVDYMWPKPGADKPSEKISYIYRPQGEDVLFGAGIYK